MMRNEITDNREGVFDVVYKMINSKANSNAFIQGISGIAGFPATIAVDAAVLFTHYEPMINDIRKLYGRSVLCGKDISPVLSGLFKEILLDIAVDKVLGYIPVAGIYFNAISAKALTWRLGMLVTIISSRGEEFTQDNLSNVIKLIRNITPQTDMFKFTKPNYEAFKKIVFSISNDDMTTFEDKLKTALEAFE